jgi:hypothetical protein
VWAKELGTPGSGWNVVCVLASRFSCLSSFLVCIYTVYIYIYIHTYDLNFMLLILTEFSFDAYLFAISVPPLLASVQDSFYFLIFGIINQWVYIWFNNQIKTTKWNHNYLWLGLRIGRCDLEHPAGMILEVSKLLLKHLLSCLRSSHISITLC